METRPVGTSDVRLSVVGLGGFELGPDALDSPDIDRAVAVIEASVDAGVNWLDTSENYLETRNESLIGAALRRVGSPFAISSKVAPNAAISGGGSGFRGDQVHAACRESLQRLGRDVIDVYLLHWPDDSGVPLEETWGAMGELAEDGLVRAVGLSNYEIEGIEQCHEQRPVDVIQTGLSLVDYLKDRPLIARCGELDIAVTIFEPLASGVLTGRSLEQVRARWTGVWEDTPFYQLLLSPGQGERSMAVADGLRPIAQRLDATVAQVAIAWVLQQRGVTAAITGSCDGRHMKENAAAADVDLRADLAEIDALIPLGPSFG
jgi:aryl-alcohol dehydrogenase-like predicted oxidoreductase